VDRAAAGAALQRDGSLVAAQGGRPVPPPGGEVAEIEPGQEGVGRASSRRPCGRSTSSAASSCRRREIVPVPPAGGSGVITQLRQHDILKGDGRLTRHTTLRRAPA
jgi:hypothetical protein